VLHKLEVVLEAAVELGAVDQLEKPEPEKLGPPDRQKSGAGD
jgi:hypothetical protein